jgi:arylsulfatase A-like enzyme
MARSPKAYFHGQLLSLITVDSLMKASLLLTLLLPFAAPFAADVKPNILVILADDLGFGDVQCNNPERGKISTPNIDKLAAQGMRFTDGHSSSGVCSPSRYTLLTGRYHWRTRLQRSIVGVFGEPLIAPDRMTIGTLAKQQGYRTACIGKWHLGWDWPITQEQRPLLTPSKQPNDEAGKRANKAAAAGAVATEQQIAAWRDIFSKPIPGGPSTRGFDLYFGTDIPNWPPFCFIENDRTLGIPTEFLPSESMAKNQASNQGPALKGWKLEGILPALGDRTIRFIDESVQKKEPFLVYMPLTSPHTPLAVNPEWKDKSHLNLFADFVMETDAVVGRVLDALEKSGAAENTLVIFTADNGCAPYIGVKDLEQMGHYPSGPLRGYKADAWEGGHRVPFMVRWPGVVKPGSVCGQLVYQADLIRTFADMFGVKLPENAGEDSFSLMPLLKGADQPIRENAVSASIGGIPGVRSGSWKYIPAPGSGGWGSGGDQSQPVQLYNLADDIGETKNLAAAMPEKVAEMKALLEKLITDGRSTPGALQKNDVEVVRYPRPEAPKRKTRAKK